MKAIDAYLANQPTEVRDTLKKLRKTIKAVAPEAEELISYQMPAFRFHGMLVGFSAFKNHCSFFPWNSSTVKQFKVDLQDFSTSKGTIRFTVEKPLPDALVRRIVRARMQENLLKEERKRHDRKRTT